MNLSSTFSSPLSTSHSVLLPASSPLTRLSPSALYFSLCKPSMSSFASLFLSLIRHALLFFIYTLSPSLCVHPSLSLPESLSTAPGGSSLAKFGYMKNERNVGSHSATLLLKVGDELKLLKKNVSSQ